MDRRKEGKNLENRTLVEEPITVTAVSVIAVATAIGPVYAALGDQTIVKDYVAAVGWTSIVPMNVDGKAPTDYLSTNATTGRAIVSVGVGDAGEQQIVKDYVAATGWTSIVPMNVDGDFPGLTDYLSYNATTGQAIASVGIGTSGDQKVSKTIRQRRDGPPWCL